MRIVLDLQGAQTESRFRGIGRYTIEFTKALLRNRGEHEIILVLSGLFHDTIDKIKSDFENLLPSENILVWNAPGPTRDIDATNKSNREIAEIIREDFLNNLAPDIIHINSLFEGYVDDAVTSIGRVGAKIPTSVILYDLIPLLNPRQYLDDSTSYKAHYLRKINELSFADTYFTISQSAKSEILSALNFDEDLVTNIKAAANELFKEIEIDDIAADALYIKYNIARNFIFYSGGSDKRKNLDNLISAYAKLPPDLRSKHQLVFGGRFPESDIAKFKQLATRSGLKSNELSIIDHVSDEDLVKLYNLCYLYVFPSLHEGFGLPVLEAMACGAAVIGSNSSSLPELFVDDKVMFDGSDVATMSAMMKQALSDKNFHDFLLKNSRLQRNSFSWDKTALQSISIWENLHKQAKSNIDREEPEKDKRPNDIDMLEKISELTDNAKNSSLIQLANCLASNENEILTFLGQVIPEEEINWRLEGPFDSNYSLALLNREIARSLVKRGVKVALYSTEGPGDFEPSKQFLEANPDIEQMYLAAKSLEQNESSVVSRNLYPARVEDMKGPLNLIHSYAWEESSLPIDRVRAFNSSLDVITCLSKHVRKVLRDNGVRIPLEVTGAGFDHWERYEDVQLSILEELGAKAFRFIHVSSFFPRKGPDVLLESWAKAFSAKDDVCLVIKTFPNPHNLVHDQINNLKRKYPDCAQIILIEDDLSTADLKSLFKKCNVLVAPSFAEGFCLPIGEAMLSGLPAITTNWSGQLDFCAPENSWLLDYEFQQAESHFGLMPSVWARVSVNSLTDAMQSAFNSEKSQLARMAQNGKELILNNFTWDHVADKLIHVYNKYYNESPGDGARIGVISTYNTKCGIAEYTRHLISNFKYNTPSILATRTHETNSEDPSSCHRCWVPGDDDLVMLSETVEHLKLNTLLIQWNFGFFDQRSLTEFVRNQKASNKVIVFDLHAVQDPPQNTSKKLIDYVDALSLADRIMVHSIPDMNRLKEVGLVENVVLFPLGVVEKKLKPKSKSSIPTIATYGFCLPHKGLSQVIDSMKLLNNSGRKCNLRMFNAEYPDPTSTQLVNKLRKQIKDSDLEHLVKFESNFLSDDETLERLQEADMMLFPYDPSSESASAAVRFGLASHKPTLVTNIPLFEEFGEAVWKVDNNNPINLARAIESTLDNILANSELYLSKKTAADMWVKQHSFDWLSERLEGMLEGLCLDLKN
jgi:glycosyltransferase involved in cell wall biosynthesis